MFSDSKKKNDKVGLRLSLCECSFVCQSECVRVCVFLQMFRERGREREWWMAIDSESGVEKSMGDRTRV